MNTIGKITLETLPEVREIGEKFTASVNYPGGFNFEAFSAAWSVALEYDLGVIFCARDEVGKVVGLFGAHFSDDPFSGWKTANESFWFVLPEARSSSVGIRLFNAFESEAKERDCKKILMVHLKGEFEAPLAALYERRGYRLLEQTFGKEI